MTAIAPLAPVEPTAILGRTEPRLWTPPLRPLTEDTSYGFGVIRFADRVLGHPLDPWQEWLVIHAGELLPDGSPRFSTVLVLVARQNGKTEVLVVLSLYWLFVERLPLILGTSTKLDYAKESWRKCVKLAQGVDLLAAEIPRRGVRETNGEQELSTVDDCRYKIAASNAEGGRSLSIDRAILDELRQHTSYAAWDSIEPATSARPGSQLWALSNAGSDTSVVLNDKRAEALAAIDAGEQTDLALFEWSAPEDADPLDVHAHAQANPNLNRRKDGRRMLANARRAVASGGEALNGFLTESMCIRVRLMNPAVDPARWGACLVPGDLSAVRSRVALCLDIAPDGLHATLAAAAVLADGRVRVEIVAAWDGIAATDKLRRELSGWHARVRPSVQGWLPAGPAAALAANLKARPGVRMEEIRGEVTAVCMGLAEQVAAGQLVHGGDPLLDAQIGGAERLNRGDGWVFSRKGAGHVDAVYAAAGAVHLARTLPVPVGKPRLVTVD